jgi:hypothetical protein
MIRRDARWDWARWDWARWNWFAALGIAIAVVACASAGSRQGSLHRWWSGLGPVVSHEEFPADCSLCHRGARWNDLVSDFEFDHEARTGVPLRGAHAQAMCLRCHNDRGPVAVFAQQGCAGCHVDRHFGELGRQCADCHGETTWMPDEQRVRHYHTRFPLIGAHAGVACHRCHAGAFVGNFLPTDPDCETCHLDEALQVNNPPHAGLGWVNDCDRCHMPTRWQQAVIR